MKKLFTLLLLTITAFTFKAVAQSTTCNAAFDVSITNLSVHFTPAISTDPNVNHHYWQFGDGSISSDISPTHLYASSGTYTVKHVFYRSNSNGELVCKDSVEKRIELRAVTECNLTAYFSYQFDPTNHNKVFFVNQSIPATANTAIQWSFGDGTTSTSNNPDHVYAHSGNYNVCIRVTNGTNCVKEFCKTLEIKEAEVSCADASKFTFTRSTVNCLEFKFVPVNQNPNWKYVWSFGDGTGSNDMLPAGHVYPRSGNYTVYLTIFRSTNCVSTSHKLVEIGTCFSCNNIWAKYEYRKENASSNKFFFHAISNYPMLSQTWTITKLNVSGSATVTLNQNNPDYTFKEPGDYRVCLKAVTAANCVKEYCEVIHINAPNAECTLSAYPNPATNQITLSLQLVQPVVIHVYIYNSMNILVKHKDQMGSAGNNVITTNLEGLVPGSYSVKVIYGNRICYSKFQKL